MQPFEKMLQQLPVVVFQLQLLDNGLITFPYINESAFSIFEYTSTEIISDSKTALSKVNAHDTFAIKRIIKSSLQNMHSIDFDLRLDHSKRGIIWVNISASPERVGTATIWHGCLKDVTKEKEQFLYLVESERKYRATIENSLNGFIIGRDGAVLDANRAAIKMFGYDSLDEMKEKHRADLFDDQSEEYQKIKRERTINGKARGEVRGIKKNGEYFPCIMFSNFFTDANGTSNTINSFIDISEEVEAKEKLTKNQQLLSQAEILAEIGSSEIDYKTGKFLWSDGFYKIHGLEPTGEEITDKISAQFLHPDDRYKIALLEEAPKKKVDHLELDSKIIRADGVEREISSYWKFTYDSEGMPLKMYGVVQDITARKEQERLLKSLNNELVSKASKLLSSNKELERFAYVASHDLQEPLRNINGALQLLKEKYKDQLDDRANEFIDYSINSSIRMKELITDLLEFSRVDNTVVEMKDIDLNEVIEEVILTLAPVIEREQGKIKIGKLPIVNGVQTQIVQLFQNLIGNALKYRSKERLPYIEIKTMEEDKEWKISISDNGIGIDDRYYDKIFVIFQRLHKKYEYNGTGIGLAICKKIVENHGGSIGVTSKVGIGSSFHFTLPK